MCDKKQEMTKEEKLEKAKELLNELKNIELSPEELEKVSAGFWGGGWGFPPTFQKEESEK